MMIGLLPFLDHLHLVVIGEVALERQANSVASIIRRILRGELCHFQWLLQTFIRLLESLSELGKGLLLISCPIT